MWIIEDCHNIYRGSWLLPRGKIIILGLRQPRGKCNYNNSKHLSFSIVLCIYRNLDSPPYQQYLYYRITRSVRRRERTVAITMADSLCGPSNPLQSLQKQTSVDRTLQQDRLIPRPSPIHVCFFVCLIGYSKPNLAKRDSDLHQTQAPQLPSLSDSKQDRFCTQRTMDTISLPSIHTSPSTG